MENTLIETTGETLLKELYSDLEETPRPRKRSRKAIKAALETAVEETAAQLDQAQPETEVQPILEAEVSTFTRIAGLSKAKKKAGKRRSSAAAIENSAARAAAKQAPARGKVMKAKSNPSAAVLKARAASASNDTAPKKPTRKDTHSVSIAAAKKAKEAKEAPAPAAPSKQQQAVEMLSRPNGAALPELMSTFGWQAHTVRGFIAGTVSKKMGLAVISTKEEDGIRRYRIAS